MRKKLNYPRNNQAQMLYYRFISLKNIKRHRPTAVMLGTDWPVARINKTPEDYDIIMNCKFKLELYKQLRH